MRICLISNLYPPYNRGGAEQVVKNTVEGLLSRGHQVAVITARPSGVSDPLSISPLPTGQAGLSWGEGQTPPDKEGQGRSKVYRFFPWNLFFYGNDYKYPAGVRFFWHIFDVFNLYSFFKVRAILKKEKPDVVHTHNLKGLGYLIPWAIRSLGLRHVHTLHDVQLVEPSGIIIKGEENSWRYNGWPVKLYTNINRRLFGSPQVVISPSKFLMGFYEKRGFFSRSKKIILPNPVVGTESPEHLNTKTREQLNFLYLGQIEEHKGISLLIQAFKKIISNIKYPISLHVVGSGSRLEEAKRLATDCPQIIFHGKADRAELPGIFNQTDVIVVPSLCYENSPTVIFESFSFGVPVLASSIEGVAELIRDNENGWTFEAGSAESLATKLRWCALNPDKIKLMRASALKSVEGLGLETYLDKLLNYCYRN